MPVLPPGIRQNGYLEQWLERLRYLVHFTHCSNPTLDGAELPERGIVTGTGPSSKINRWELYRWAAGSGRRIAAPALHTATPGGGRLQID